MNNQSSLKKVKQGKYVYIYIYFKCNGKILRINTGNKVVPRCMNKDLTYNSKMVDQVELNIKTIELKQKVDEYIKYGIEGGKLSLISQKDCLTFIKGETTPPTFTETSNSNSPTVNQLLNDFYQFKKDELNNRPSYKDYLSLVNSLIDYQTHFSTELSLDTMNTLDFMVKYRNFLSLTRGEGFLTKGGLNDNTINKRYSGLKTFFIWLEDREIYQFKKSVHHFNIPKFDNNIVVLDKNDIKQLIELDIDNKSWRKMVDLFVCNCFLGLRYSDLFTLKKSDFIIDDDGDYILIKENKKTNFYVQIPVQKTSLYILKKYDFELPKFCHQFFNREFKKILKEYNLFSDKIIKKRRVNKIVEDYEVVRRELISSHSCRRTFITLGISHNIPLNSLMLSTGHKKIQTLQHYMKKILDKKSFNKIDL